MQNKVAHNLNGLITVNSFYVSDNVNYQVTRLKQEFSKLGVNVKTVTLAGNLYIDEKGNAINLTNANTKYDFNIFLDKDKHAAAILEKSGQRLFNSRHAVEVCNDKMLTYISLSGMGINMPKTIPSPLIYENLPKKDFDKKQSDFLNFVIGTLSFPLIVKTCYGSGGKGVFLINNKTQLDDIFTKLKFTPHLYQQYIPQNIVSDMRVMVVGGKAISIINRIAKMGEYRSNIEQGGRGLPLDVSQENASVALAEKAAACLNLDFCGVDILKDTDEKLYLLEVNSNAFFKESESVSGVNIASKIAKHIVYCVKKA